MEKCHPGVQPGSVLLLLLFLSFLLLNTSCSFARPPVWCLVCHATAPSPSFILSLSLFLSVSLHFIHLLSLFHATAETRLLLRDGRWTYAWTGCKDLPNQGLFDLLLYMQSECMFSRCGSLRPRVSGRRILLVSARGNTSLIISA